MSRLALQDLPVAVFYAFDKCFPNDIGCLANIGQNMILNFRNVVVLNKTLLGCIIISSGKLTNLIQTGETDPSVFLWAGHLAETQKDWPAAETLYDQARRRNGRPARLATLYLARLHFRRGRLTQAAQLLRKHLDTYAEDAPARALLALVEARAGMRRDE